MELLILCKTHMAVGKSKPCLGFFSLDPSFLCTRQKNSIKPRHVCLKRLRDLKTDASCRELCHVPARPPVSFFCSHMESLPHPTVFVQWSGSVCRQFHVGPHCAKELTV